MKGTPDVYCVKGCCDIKRLKNEAKNCLKNVVKNSKP